MHNPCRFPICRLRNVLLCPALLPKDLPEDYHGATDTAVQLSAVQEEAARLRRLLAGKARQVSALQAGLTSARQSEASASAAQQQLKQQRAAALAAALPKAVGQSSKGQSGEVAQLQQQLQDLQEQLQQAKQHEAAAIADKAAAQQTAAMLTGQVRSVAQMDEACLTTRCDVTINNINNTNNNNEYSFPMCPVLMQPNQALAHSFSCALPCEDCSTDVQH